MGRFLAFAFGLVSYVTFLMAFVYLIGFVGGFGVPKDINSGTPSTSLGAIFLNIFLVALFAVQHTIMARPAFKRWWTQIVPKAIERSIFVLLASLILLLLYWQWTPMPQIVWEIQSPFLAYCVWAIFWTGWGIALLSTFLINHFDLFGLRQVTLNLQRREYTPIGFRNPWLYRLIRHPLMFGILLSIWAVPVMTMGHVIFAVSMTSYVMVALQFEERDLASMLGSEYQAYQAQTPKLIPFAKASRSTEEKHTPTT